MSEWFTEYEANRTADPGNDFAGDLTQGDVDEIAEMLADAT